MPRTDSYLNDALRFVGKIRILVYYCKYSFHTLIFIYKYRINNVKKYSCFFSNLERLRFRLKKIINLIGRLKTMYKKNIIAAHNVYLANFSARY